MDFEAYRDAMLRDLAPVGTAETALAERIVSLSWRLRQAEARETEALDDMIAKETSNPLAKLADSLLAEGVDLMGDDPETDPDLAVGRAVAKDFSGDSVLERLSISERQIENSLFKTLHEFQRLQSMRKSGRSGKGDGIAD
jgi:hypothetical protein